MYKASFIEAHKRSRSKLPIHIWHQAVGKNLPQFQTDEDIYLPVPIYVKISGGINDPNGTVRLSVCPTNPNWYRDLTDALSDMTQIQDVDVINMEGKCISNLDTQTLFVAGECDVVNKRTGKVIRLPSVVEPPARMATNKAETLKKWWESTSENISREVAQALSGKNMIEIEAASDQGGAIHETLKASLGKCTSDDFFEIYGSGIPRTSADELSDKLLGAICDSLVANEEQITKYHAASSSNKTLWRKKETENVRSAYLDDFTMYRDFIDDAIIRPDVSRNIIHSILFGKKRISSSSLSEPKKEIIVSDYHPLENFYKVHYYNTYGKLPGHVVNAYNKNIGSNMQAKTFPGDADEAFCVFHMLSGYADIGLLGFGKKKKKKKPKKPKKKKKGFLKRWKERRQRRKMRRANRQGEVEVIDRGRPTATIPDEVEYGGVTYTRAAGNMMHISSLDEGELFQKELERLIPVSSKSDYLERLIPVSSRENVAGGDVFTSGLIRDDGVYPRLIPVSNRIEEEEEEDELPTISQLLSRKY